MAEKKPNIRFKGFEEEWEDKTLGSMGETFSGLSGKSKKDFGHGDAQYITYMNVFSNPIASPDGVDKVEIDTSQNAVHKGDILFTTSSETPEEVGMSSVWLEEKPHTYLNSFCFGYRPIVPLDPHFSAYLMRSPKMRDAFYFLAQGISRFNISKQKAMDIETSIPQETEQRKIGEFFKQLDELIGAKEQELEKLRQIKLALLDKMFPSDNQENINGGGKSLIYKMLQNSSQLVASSPAPNTPTIRFRGFTEPWVKKKLCSIIELNGGIDYKKLSPGNIPVYGTGGYMLSVNKALSYEKDAIGIGRKGTIDKPFILHAPFWTVDTLFYAIPRERQDLNFCFCLFQIVDWKKHDESTGVPSLSKSVINSIEVLVSSNYDEQCKIGDFFRSQDEAIANSRLQINKLKTIKQACLSQMFA